MKAALPLALASVLSLAACAPAAKAPRLAPAVPPAASGAAPAPPDLSANPAPPPGTHWMDAALTPGRWRYEPSAARPSAVFASPRGAETFVMACERASARLTLSRAGTSEAPRTMTIRTETATRTLSAAPTGDADPSLAASLAADDPLLDAMALSKGRFAVEVEGTPALYLPSWAEVSRVIEDCR